MANAVAQVRKRKNTKHIEHRVTDVLVAFVAFSLLITMSTMVANDHVATWEILGFEFINGLPDFLYPILWPFMQYGVFVTIPFVSAVALYFRRFKLAILLLIGGIGIYYGARLFKEYVPRGRPGDLLTGVNAREQFAQYSKGFTSGHTAVASTIATFSHYYLSKKWQILSLLTLGIVVIGRMYVGAHLPLDVLGGVALGIGVASLLNFVVGVPISDAKRKEDTKQWIRQHRPRHPGDIIRIGIGALFFSITTILALSGTVGPLEEAMFHVINFLPSFLNPIIQIIMQFGALYFVFVACIIALLYRHNRLFLKILGGGVGVWTLARIAKSLIDRERPAYLLTEIIDRSSSSGLGFPSGHASVAALIATVSAPYVSKRWSRIFWALAWTTALGRVFVGAHLPLDIIAGLALGWSVGSLMNVAFGTPAKPWPKIAVIDRLKDAGYAVRSIVDADVDARGSIPLIAKTKQGTSVFIKLIDSEHRNADILYRLWRYISLREVQDEAPFATPKQLAEHEAYLTIQASQAGVRVPEVLLASPVNKSNSIIVYENLDAQILANYDVKKIDQKLLLKIWRLVAKLHAKRIAHRDLRATNIMIDSEAIPWLIDFSFSQTAASDTLLYKDIVELLVSLSLITDAGQVVETARTVFGDKTLLRIVPYIQPLALTTYTRKRLRDHPDLLEEISHEISGHEAHLEPKVRLSRFNIRWIVFVAIIALVVYYFIPRIGELNESIDAIRSAELLPLIALLLTSLLTYVFSAIVVQGATLRKLAYWPLLIVQFAGTAVNRITPKGVGGAVLLERYLEKNKLSRLDATVSTSLVYAVGFLIHSLLTLIVVAVDDPDLFQKVDITTGQWTLIGVGLLTVLSGVFFIVPAKRFFLTFKSGIIRNLREVIRKPKKSLQLFGGSVGVTLSYAIAFGFAIEAFGDGIALTEVLFVYLASGIIASAAPTPGGLGATEAALTIGLTFVSVPIGQAVAAVLVFRVFTFWLPIIPGVLALRYLRRRKLL